MKALHFTFKSNQSKITKQNRFWNKYSFYNVIGYNSCSLYSLCWSTFPTFCLNTTLKAHSYVKHWLTSEYRANLRTQNQTLNPIIQKFDTLQDNYWIFESTSLRTGLWFTYSQVQSVIPYQVQRFTSSTGHYFNRSLFNWLFIHHYSICIRWFLLSFLKLLW